MADLDKMPDMLPCPFCGSDRGQVLKFKSSAREGYRARCCVCGVTQGHPIVYGSTRNAIEAWNKRAALLTAPPGWKLVPVELIDAFPEINPSNYSHKDACALNAWGIEVVQTKETPDV